MRSVMYVGLVVASLLGLWWLGHSVPSTIVDCPSINVDCPSNCNYDRYYVSTERQDRARHDARQCQRQYMVAHRATSSLPKRGRLPEWS